MGFGRMVRWVVVVTFLVTWLHLCVTKTITGVFSSREARYNKGQYITNFYFSGEGAQLSYDLLELPADHLLRPSLLLYLDTDWDIASSASNSCHHKLQLARATHTLLNISGDIPLAHFGTLPRQWHIVYKDAATCSQDNQSEAKDDGEEGEDEEETFTELRFILKLLNPDVIGNPTEHFGADQTGLFRFYQLLLLAYFVLGCICGPKLYETIHKGGPMQILIQLLSAATCLQAAAVLLMCLHWRVYSRDGIGSPFWEFSSRMVDLASHLVMLLMLMSLSLGWTMGTALNPAHMVSQLRQKPATRGIFILAGLQGLLFIGEQYQESQRVFKYSLGNVAMVTLRVLLAAIFVKSLQKSIATERSALKRDFYLSFIKSCLLWFLSYPVLVVLSFIFSAYSRFKLVTMGVMACQCVAVLLLYRLFLSRSLYWEVSSLSSYIPLRIGETSHLPLHIQKPMGHKLYS